MAKRVKGEPQGVNDSPYREPKLSRRAQGSTIVNRQLAQVHGGLYPVLDIVSFHVMSEFDSIKLLHRWFAQ